jgi:hypothetical protein
LSTFFDVGEVVFDGIEVGAIRRKKKDEVTVLVGDGFEVFLFMESGIVPDDG